MEKSQLIFDFSNGQNNNEFAASDFIVNFANENAYNFLEKFFKQNDFSISAVILQGPNGCGKTYLLNIFAQKTAAIFLNKNDLKTANLSSFFAANNFYILEDIDSSFDETLLFHIINSAFEARSCLVLTCNQDLNFQLKDLDSRIKNIIKIKIEDANEELLKMLLIQGFSKKQLKINNEIIDYLANRLASYEVVARAIKNIEDFCHSNKKKLNLTDVKKLLG